MNGKVAAAGAFALLLLLMGSAQAKPHPQPPPPPPPPPPKPSIENWNVTLFLIPAILEDDTGDAEDAIHNGVVSKFAQVNGVIRNYEVSDARNVLKLLVVFQGTPNIAVGSSFSLPGNTKATVLSASRAVNVSV